MPRKSNKSKHFDSFQGGVFIAFPVIVSYIFIGFVAGSLNAVFGFSVLEVMLFSLLIYSGSAQFVFPLLYTGSPFFLVSTIFLLQFRHFFYGLSFFPLVKNLPLIKRIIIGLQLTDETFVVSSSFRKEPFQKARGMIALNICSYISWFLGTSLGAFFGSSDFLSYFVGLQFTLTAMFTSILVLQWLDASDRLQVGLLILFSSLTVVFLELFFPDPSNLLVTILVVCTLGMFLEERKNDN